MKTMPASPYVPFEFDNQIHTLWRSLSEPNIAGTFAYQARLQGLIAESQKPWALTMDSLKTLDVLLSAIKSDLAERQINEALILNHDEFIKLISVISHHVVQVIERGMTQALTQIISNPQIELYTAQGFNKVYARVVAGFDSGQLLDSEVNGYYYGFGLLASGVKPTGQTVSQSLFILPIIGARVFGTMDRSFVAGVDEQGRPLTNTTSEDSLYYAVKDFLQNFSQINDNNARLVYEMPKINLGPSKATESAPDDDFDGLIYDEMDDKPAPQQTDGADIMVFDDLEKSLLTEPAQTVQSPATTDGFSLPDFSLPAINEVNTSKTEPELVPSWQEGLASMMADVNQTTPSTQAVNPHLLDEDYLNPNRMGRVTPAQATTAQLTDTGGEFTTPATNPIIGQSSLSHQAPQHSHLQQDKTTQVAHMPNDFGTGVPNQQVATQSTPTQSTPTQNSPMQSATTHAQSISAQPQGVSMPVTDLSTQGTTTPTSAPSTPMTLPKTASERRQRAKASHTPKLFNEAYEDLMSLSVASDNDLAYAQAASVLNVIDKHIQAEQDKGVALNDIHFDTAQTQARQQALTSLVGLVGQNNPSAMLRLSLYYFEGRGIPADTAKAVMLVKRAADMGDMRAQKLLSRLYYQGYDPQNGGIAMEVEMGELWLHKAADNGHPEAKKIRSYMTQVQALKADRQSEAQSDTRYLKWGAALFVALIFIIFVITKFAG